MYEVTFLGGVVGFELELEKSSVVLSQGIFDDNSSDGSNKESQTQWTSQM